MGKRKQAPRKAATRGRDRPAREEESPRERSPMRSPSDDDDAASNVSRASSVAASTDTLQSLPASQESLPTLTKRGKKSHFPLDTDQEQLMLEYLQANEMLWDIKQTDYRRVDKKNKLWEEQAKALGKTVEHLQGWFKSLRDNHTRLHKNKSGDGATELTQREKWILDNFGFLKRVVRHRPEPVRSVRETIAAHSGDLDDAEAACVDMEVEDPADPRPSTSQRKSKPAEDKDLIQSLQKSVQQSGEILKNLTAPQKVTSNEAFANYVRDSLVTMSKDKFKKARTRINRILTELMEEDSDEEPTFATPHLPASRPSSAPAAASMSEMYQPPPHMWRHRPPPASTWASQSSEYVYNYLQQPLQQQPVQYPAPPPQPQYQPVTTAVQPRSSVALSTFVASASQVLNPPSSSVLDTSLNLDNISGLSGLLNVSSTGDSSTPASAEIVTPPPAQDQD